MGAAARARAASRAGESPIGQGAVSFESLVKEGIDLHDRAEKKRNDNPTLAIQLYRGALQAYERAEQLISGEEKSSADLSFNMGVAYSGLATVYKSMETRNSAEQADENLLLACQCYSHVLKIDPENAEALNNWVCQNFRICSCDALNASPPPAQGSALSSFAEGRSGAEAVGLLQEACGKLEQACVRAIYARACTHGCACTPILHPNPIRGLGI